MLASLAATYETKRITPSSIHPSPALNDAPRHFALPHGRRARPASTRKGRHLEYEAQSPLRRLAGEPRVGLLPLPTPTARSNPTSPRDSPSPSLSPPLSFSLHLSARSFRISISISLFMFISYCHPPVWFGSRLLLLLFGSLLCTYPFQLVCLFFLVGLIHSPQSQVSEHSIVVWKDCAGCFVYLSVCTCITIDLTLTRALLLLGGLDLFAYAQGV